MIGTVVNAISIIIGGLVGVMLKKGIKPKYQEAIDKALGLSIIILGLNGVISNMFKVSDDSISSSGELLLIISLVIGVIIGEWLDIDQKLVTLSLKIEHKFKLSGFAQSFMNGTLIYCIGAMAIVGALNDGLSNDPSILFIKSLLDGISSVVLGASLGVGVVFASIPVFIYQGTISLLASTIQPFMSSALLSQICMVGFVLVICIGVNFFNSVKFKTANFLPALLIPIFYNIIMALF